MKYRFNASILSLFNFEDKEIKNFIDQDSEIYNFVDKSKIKDLLKENGYSKFLSTFLSLKTFMNRFKQ
jgi:hypothetical protein